VSLGALGGQPHRTARGQQVPVTEWSAMAQVALIDPADAAAFGVGPADVEHAGYRIVAEALDNAVLHAQARTVVVSMHRNETRLTLQISDDGCGLPARARAEGSGLRRMRERAAACGGAVDVSTGEAGGVEVLVRLPWSGGTV